MIIMRKKIKGSEIDSFTDFGVANLVLDQGRCG